MMPIRRALRDPIVTLLLVLMLLSVLQLVIR
jgi:hypothetical protein